MSGGYLSRLWEVICSLGDCLGQSEFLPAAGNKGEKVSVCEMGKRCEFQSLELDVKRENVIVSGIFE
jgi:hypothetical protein